MNRRELLKAVAGTAALPFVKNVQVLRVQPEDTIVITCEDHLSDAARHRLKETWEQFVPTHAQRVVVLDGGLDVKVLCK